MKYRIVKNGLGKYLIQSKKHWLAPWETLDTTKDDYPGSDDLSYMDWIKLDDHNDCVENVFSSLLLAQLKINKLITKIQTEERKNELYVVEEMSV